MTDPEDRAEPPDASRRGRFRNEASELLHRLTRLVGEHGDYLSEAAPKLDKLARDLTQLDDRVQRLAEAIADDQDNDDPEDATLEAHGLPRQPRGPICWPILGPDEAAVMWQVLATWLGEVVVPEMRPTRRQLPDCWALHPQAVTALTWAWECYRAAYTGPAHAAARAEWATRWWPGALEAIRHSIDPALCSPGYHLMSKQDRDDVREEQRVARGETSYAAGRDDLARRARKTARETRRGADRPRVLAGGPDSALDNAGLPEALLARPSIPRLWVWLYREAAAADIERRRRRTHLHAKTDYRLTGENPIEGPGR